MHIGRNIDIHESLLEPDMEGWRLAHGNLESGNRSTRDQDLNLRRSPLAKRPEGLDEGIVSSVHLIERIGDAEDFIGQSTERHLQIL